MRGGKVTQMKKNKSKTQELREDISNSMEINAFLNNLLLELERIENIRDALYKEYENGSVTEEYTNKANATNLIINACIKEYKSYSQRFNDLMKTIYLIIKNKENKSPSKDEEDDDLEKINKRRDTK